MSIARLMAWSEGRNGRTPGNGPKRSSETGSSTSCRKNTKSAQFHGQSSFPETGRHTGRSHCTKKKTHAPTSAPGYLFSEGAQQKAVISDMTATTENTTEPV